MTIIFFYLNYFSSLSFVLFQTLHKNTSPGNQVSSLGVYSLRTIWHSDCSHQRLCVINLRHYSLSIHTEHTCSKHSLNNIVKDFS